MKTNKYAITLFLLSLFTLSFAQSDESKEMEAYLKKQKNGDAVAFGAVKNEKTGEVVLSDTEGYFKIHGSVGDTIRFHSLGYKDTTWVVSGIWHSMDEAVMLNVQTNIYALDEIEVVRYYSYAHFKQAFKDLKLPKTEDELAKEMVNSWGNDFEEAIAWGKADKKAASGTFGVSLSLGGKDPIALARERVKELEKIADESTRFNYFTSRENIASLTGYQGTCLDSFMVFLNTQYSLHYKMEEYQLLSSILGAHSQFKSLKQNEEWYLECDTLLVQ